MSPGSPGRRRNCTASTTRSSTFASRRNSAISACRAATLVGGSLTPMSRPACAHSRTYASGAAGDRPAPRLVRAEERLGERVVHPAQQLLVVRGVAALDARGVDVRARDALVQPAHERRRRGGAAAVAERRRRDPAHGAVEAPERILVVARPVVHAGHRTGMQGLQQQRADAGDERRQRAVDGPHRAAGPEEPGVVALGERTRPRRPLGARRPDGAPAGRAAARSTRSAIVDRNPRRAREAADLPRTRVRHAARDSRTDARSRGMQPATTHLASVPHARSGITTAPRVLLRIVLNIGGIMKVRASMKSLKKPGRRPGRAPPRQGLRHQPPQPALQGPPGLSSSVPG